MRFRVLFGVGLIIALSASLTALSIGDEAEEPIDFEKILCPVSKKKVDESATREHEDCTVYFCCNNCAKAFEDDDEKFLARANHQKVATRQCKQTKCPKSFQDVKASTALEVGGVDVTFCCNKCRGWADELADGDSIDDQIAKLFGEKVFEKAFEVIEDDDDDA